jgi:hypothetical protein
MLRQDLKLFRLRPALTAFLNCDVPCYRKTCMACPHQPGQDTLKRNSRANPLCAQAKWRNLA